VLCRKLCVLTLMKTNRQLTLTCIVMAAIRETLFVALTWQGNVTI